MPNAQWNANGGSVVAFAGHMVDAPHRPQPRFPPDAETKAAAAIRERLQACDARAGVSALASGADILFAEAILERRGELHVILPLNVEEFLEESVRPSGDERWEARFNTLREKAASLNILGDDYFRGSGAPFQLTALLIDGTTQYLAHQRKLDSRTLCIWDGRPGDGLGGTASFIGHAVRQGRVVQAIAPATANLFTPGEEAIAAAQKHNWGVRNVGTFALEHRLMAYLFADVKGFSRLRETQVPIFARVVLNIIKKAMNEVRTPPLVLNTWGDGLFIATEQPKDAAEIALRLIECADRIDHAAEGLPSPLRFRVGLHAGPGFYLARDPLTERPNVYGQAVSRAARIEPVVKEGEAWASRTFMLLAQAIGCQQLGFDDLGTGELHKSSGTMHLFRIRRG